MSNEAELELQMAGMKKQYDYTEYAHTNHVNVIPEQDFKRLVSDTFNTITDILKQTYGPYGSSVVISDQSETTTTKDGYNVFQSIGFNHAYKRKVYLAINKIITRVNKNVGDGTTSCVLLAEKIFNNLNKIINTPDEKRIALELLSEIERNLQDNSIIVEDIKEGKILPIDINNIKALISVAANYDEELVNVLYNAFNPSEESGSVAIRTVIPRSEVDIDAGSNVSYEIDYLPGDYRINAFSDIDTSAKFNGNKTLKCVLYDHSFNSTDWLNFIKNWDKNEEVLIIARDFNRSFLSQDWKDFVNKTSFNKKAHALGVPTEVNAHLFWMGGSHKQDELKDLAAVLGTEVRDMNEKEVDFSELPVVTVSLYKGNCLAFYDVKGKVDTSRYVESLEAEVTNDNTHSYIKIAENRRRIKAIKMESEDTLLTVKAGTSLEAKMIMDKIDDCIHIVESGLNSGIVPNLFRYVYDRISDIRCSTTIYFLENICAGIQDSIYGLFDDIWISKYGNSDVEGKHGVSVSDHALQHFMSKPYTSFNVITEEHTDLEKFSTSAQYDLEVVVASIAIVKYLLTSKAFIFDANLLQPVNDEGHYV